LLWNARTFSTSTKEKLTMFTMLKTTLAFLWHLALVAMWIGFAGWALVAIPVFGQALDPNPRHVWLWQHLQMICIIWLAVALLCSAIGAMLIIGPLAELVAWRSRRCGMWLTSDDMLAWPTRHAQERLR
jgi:hypothetical protein